MKEVQTFMAMYFLLYTKMVLTDVEIIYLASGVQNPAKLTYEKSML